MTIETQADETVVSMVFDAIAAVPDLPFLWFEGGALSYAQVGDRISRFATGLAAQGVRPGDRVAALLDDHPDVPALWVAANLVGAIWVPLNTALVGAFLDHQIADSDPTVVIFDAVYGDRLRNALAGATGVRLLVGEGAVDLAATHPPHLRATTLSELASQVSTAGLPPPPRPEDISLILYTSGTSGPSKGCLLPHSYMCTCTRASSPNREHGEAVLSVLPLFHMNGLVNGFLNCAVRHALLAIGGRFSVSKFWSIVERSGARHVNLLGAMSSLLAYMDDVPEIARTRGQLRVAGGAPYPPDVSRIWRERFGAEIIGSAAFGMTECAPIASTPKGVVAPAGSSGRPNDLFELRLLDNRDNEVPDGAVGEICVRPKRPGVMFSGYWRLPDVTLEAFRNLWFHTGDLARLDDGWLYFVDRKKDYVRRRGENISSQEVEHVVLSHPGVRQAAFHSVTSDMAEDDDLKLTVVPGEGSSRMSEAELYGWLIDKLPSFALPRYLEYRSELPLTASGRIRKQQLRAEGVGPTTWERPSRR